MTLTQRRTFAVAAGAGSLLALIVLDFVGQVLWFESLNKPAWQMLRLWWYLALVVPGILVGLIADRSRGALGAIAGAVGCVIASVGIWVTLLIKESANVESWLDVFLVVLLICGTCATFAWLTGAAHDRLSPNKSWERTREG